SVTLYKAVNSTGFAHNFVATVGGFTNPTYITPELTLYPDTVGPKKVRLLLPGELPDPGTVAGKSGTPTGPAADTHFIAGQSVSITVDGTDSWGNILDVSDTIDITTDDAYDSPVTRNVPLTEGTSSFNHIFITERTSDAGEVTTPNVTTITGSNILYTDQNVTVTVDDDDTVRNLQILVQGETPVPGSDVWPAGGKTGVPDGDTGTGPIENFIAGQNITVTVRAVDNYYNLVESPIVGQPLIQVTADDPNITNPIVPSAPMTNGVLTTSIQLRTRNVFPGWVLVTTGVASGLGFNNDTSANIKVEAGAMTQLQILVPGETPVQGSGTGKVGAPITQTAGIQFNLAPG
ncbi:hypothetical protein BVX98_03715, partial [bacterium F11]